tara:strand:+ start:1500 stop:1676 length:177 start_codon:yes stop_codon:yes gene_type:complete
MEEEDDGYDGSVDLSRDKVTDIQTLARLFADAAVALGYTYVKSVGFELEDETMVWSDN